MKFAPAVGSVLVLGLASAALADKIPEGKDWHYDLTGVRAVVPEAEPNDTCPGQFLTCGDIVQPALITPATEFDWYQVELTAGTIFNVGTDADGVDPVGDTRLWVYADDCVTELVYNDDGGPGFYSYASLTAAYTGVYNIKVDSYNNASDGGYLLFTECVVTQDPPENDTCDGALAIERCTEGVISGDLSFAVANYDPGVPGPSCTGYAAAGNDVTYVMNLEQNDVVSLFYFGGYDESFYIVSDCGNVSGSCLIGADDTVGTGETIDWVVPADGTYYLIVDAYGGGAGGAFELTYSINCPMPPISACCFDDVCMMLLEADCLAQGGEYQGDYSVCDPNPCVVVPVEESSWGQIKNQYR